METNKDGTIKGTVTDGESYNKIKEDIAESEGLLRKTMRANGIYEKRDMQYCHSFYRFPRIDPFNYVEGAREYVFFTKPDLPILAATGLSAEASAIPYFNFLYTNGYANTVLSDLCYNNSRIDNCPFVRILSNRKVSNIDIPDIVVEELETAQNAFGTKILYPKSSMKSDEDIDFSVEFEDTKYLEVYNFFKAYDLFRQLKWLGVMKPNNLYINHKILYDHMSMYKFLVDVDGDTILFYAKLTGIYPKTISRSTFSEIPDKGPLKVTVGFKSSGWLEDIEPNILSDFNRLILQWRNGRSYEEVDIWDNDIMAISGENVDFPYIERDNTPTIDGYYQYRLKWGKFK